MSSARWVGLSIGVQSCVPVFVGSAALGLGVGLPTALGLAPVIFPESPADDEEDSNRKLEEMLGGGALPPVGAVPPPGSPFIPGAPLPPGHPPGGIDVLPRIDQSPPIVPTPIPTPVGPGGVVLPPEAAAEATMPDAPHIGTPGAETPVLGTPPGPPGAVPGVPGAGTGAPVLGAPPGPPGAVPGVPGSDMPKPVNTPYGDTTVYDPYNNRPPWSMTPEEFQNWKNDWDKRVLRDKRRNRDLGEWDERIQDLIKAAQEAEEQVAKDRVVVATAEANAQAAAEALGNDSPLKTLRADERYKADKKKLEQSIDRAEDAWDKVEDAKENKTDAFEQARIDSEDPYPKAPGSDKKGQWDTDKNAEELGRGLVSGVLQGLGFDGSLFENPLDWGIWKLFTGGVNFGAGLLKNMDPAAMGAGTSTAGAAAGGGGGSVLGGLFQGMMPGVGELFRPAGNTPAAPSPAASVTAATARSDNPGVGPAAYTTNIDASVSQTNNGLQNVAAAAMPLAGEIATQGRWAPSMGAMPG